MTVTGPIWRIEEDIGIGAKRSGALTWPRGFSTHTGMIFIRIALGAEILFASAGITTAQPSMAVQTIFQDNVPHTDRQGKARVVFNKERSFFSIGIYHGLTGEHHGRTFDFSTLRAGGFNTVMAWEGQRLADVAKAAKKNGLQVIHRYPSDAEILKWRSSGTILAWYLNEEPTWLVREDNWRGRLAQFKARRKEIQKLDPGRAVFILDAPYIDAPWRARWSAWNSSGDISAHWNYPIIGERRYSLGGSRGIPETVSLAARINEEAKPVWLVVQAFSSPLKNWRMPSATELRAMVYAGIVHGATGILYFAYDSFVTRYGEVIGVSPETVENYNAVPGSNTEDLLWLQASEEQVTKSRALWDFISKLNAELTALTLAILSPTSRMAYRVETKLSGTPIRTIMKETEGGKILIAVNIRNAQLETQIHFGQPVRLRPLSFGDLERKFTNVKSINETFEPFEVKLFQLEDRSYRR